MAHTDAANDDFARALAPATYVYLVRTKRLRRSLRAPFLGGHRNHFVDGFEIYEIAAEIYFSIVIKSFSEGKSRKLTTDIKFKCIIFYSCYVFTSFIVYSSILFHLIFIFNYFCIFIFLLVCT